MHRCSPAPLPDSALLARYATGGSYTDCFEAPIDGEVRLSDFVAAFYITRLFKLERAVLALAGFGSTDAQAMALATGDRDTFAAWTVEDRAADQLLLCDANGRTRSWFAVEPAVAAGNPSTLLRFGSAVVAKTPAAPGETPELGMLFRLSLGAHRRYSIALLNAAHRALEAAPDQPA